MKSILLLLLAILPVAVFGQEEVELYKVCYVDNANVDYVTNKAKRTIKKATNAVTDSIIIKSRMGNIYAKCFLNDSFDDGIIHCINLAIDVWEDKLKIDKPIIINFYLSDELDKNSEIKTTVFYAIKNKKIYPLSLYKQLFKSNTTTRVAEIEINSAVDWNYSWPEDSRIWGHENLITAILRNMTHVWGFGTSIDRKINGNVGCTVKNYLSTFDELITDGKTKLSEAKDFELFFNNKIFIETKNGKYSLFSSPNGFISHRSGCYFSLKEDNLMNYPYKDKTELMNINPETLDVLSEIGWIVKDYDAFLQADNLNKVLLGNVFEEHSFSVVDEEGEILLPYSWEYQVFNKNSKRYDTFSYGYDKSFSFVSEPLGKDYVDDYSYLQGNIVCNIERSGINRRYTNAIYLDCRPLIKNYIISNVVKNSDGKNFSFDFNISQKGAYSTFIIITTEYGTIVNKTFYSQDNIVLHVENAPCSVPLYINFYSENEYGLTNRTIDGNYNSFKDVEHKSNNMYIDINRFFGDKTVNHSINFCKKLKCYEK